MRRNQVGPLLQQIFAELTKPPYFLTPERMKGAQPQKSESTSDSGQSDWFDAYGQSRRRTPRQEESSQEVNVRGRDIVATATVTSKSDTQESSKAPVKNDTASKRPTVPQGLPEAYGWKVMSKEPSGGIIRVQTRRSVYAVKSTDLPSTRIQWLHQAAKYAKSHGFPRVASFGLTKKGKPYYTEGSEVYYVTRWVEGQPANFASTQQVGQVAHALAQFHEATRGFTAQNRALAPRAEFDIARMTQQRGQELRILLAEAERKAHPDEFDQTLLQLAPTLKSDTTESLQLLEDKQCQAFLDEDRKNPGICHLDVIPSNFVYDTDRQVHLLDLDLARFAPRVLDVAHLLRRSNQLQNWNPEVAYACFLHYNMVRAMGSDEYLLIQGLLRFPYRAWRLAHTRYRVFQDEAQIVALKDYAAQDERRQAFLEAFARQVPRRA